MMSKGRAGNLGDPKRFLKRRSSANPANRGEGVKDASEVGSANSRGNGWESYLKP